MRNLGKKNIPAAAILLIALISGRALGQQIAISSPQAELLTLRGYVLVAVDTDATQISVARITDGAAPVPIQLQSCQQAGLPCDDFGGFTIFPAGRHTIVATATVNGTPVETSLSFDTLNLTNNANDPEYQDDLAVLNRCELLNGLECLLPYPSTRMMNPAYNPCADLGGQLLQGTGQVQLPGDPITLPELTPGCPVAQGGVVALNAVPLVDGLDPPLATTDFNFLDGVNPLPQILAHIPENPGPLDLAESGAPILIPADQQTPTAPPWVDIRTHDDTSLRRDGAGALTSPTVLLHVKSENPRITEPVLHWVELDSQASPGRQVLIVRPAISLVPGDRYIVAVRNLRTSTGQTIAPEAIYDVVRRTNTAQQRPTNLIQVVQRMVYHYLEIRPFLEDQGVAIEDTQIAFDFRVRSEASLNAPLEAIAQVAKDWVADKIASGAPLFTVTQALRRDENNTAYVISGTFESPLFLSDPTNPSVPMDPELDPTGLSRIIFEQVNGQAVPVVRATHSAEFSMLVPDSAMDEPSAGTETNAMFAGHGSLSSSSGAIGRWLGTIGAADTPDGRGYLAGSTSFRGFSTDNPNLVAKFIGPTYGAEVDDEEWIRNDILGSTGVSQLNNFASWRDRIAQGLINSLVLMEFMNEGVFNRHPCFQRPPPPTSLVQWIGFWLPPGQCASAAGDESRGVFPGPNAEFYYWGVSLGGLNGVTLTALSDVIDKAIIDNGGTNRAFTVQRSTAFTKPAGASFADALRSIGLDDGTNMLIALNLLHEVWVLSENDAFIHRGLPGSTDPFVCHSLPCQPGETQILLTQSWLDDFVHNHSGAMLARSLGLAQAEGSVQAAMPGIPDCPGSPLCPSGPLASATVTYSFNEIDIYNPAHAPYIPPLANRGSDVSICNSHGRNSVIPAAQAQILDFLRPGGAFVNHCVDDGICNGSSIDEQSEPLFATCPTP